MFWTAFASGFDRQNDGNWRSSALEVVEATAEIRSGMRDRHRVTHGYALERSDLLLELSDQEKVEQAFNALPTHRDLSVDQKTRLTALQAQLTPYSVDANQLFRLSTVGVVRPCVIRRPARN